MHVGTSARMHECTYAYVRTYLLACLTACLRTHARTYQPVCQPANQPACQRASLPACQPANLEAYQPTSLPTTHIHTCTKLHHDIIWNVEIDMEKQNWIFGQLNTLWEKFDCGQINTLGGWGCFVGVYKRKPQANEWYDECIGVRPTTTLFISLVTSKGDNLILEEKEETLTQ